MIPHLKSLVLGLAFLMVIGTARSQTNQDTATNYKNTIKINLAAFYFRNISLLYERQINDHLSFNIGGGFKWGGNIPKIFGLGDFIITSNTGGLQGYSLTPELRYFFNNCDCQGANTGLYAGVYSRMTNMYADLEFHYWDGMSYIDGGGYAELTEFGMGFQVGYQFLISERIIVDMMFMGPRTSHNRLKMNIHSDYAAQIIPLIEEELNRRLQSLGMNPVDIPITTDFKVDFRLNYFRYGISLGYRF